LKIGAYKESLYTHPIINLPAPEKSNLLERSIVMKITAAVVRQKTGPFLLDLNKMARFPIDKMVKYYKFSDISQAVEDSEKGRTLKAILTM